MQHSVRLYEKEPIAKLLTKIVKVVEQPIKITHEGKANMLNTLGVVLAGTIFHPQGGGQPADKGKINGVSVLAVNFDKTQANDTSLPIYHFLDPRELRNKRFSIGQQVELNLDENFRKQCQRSHTTGHLIADVLELNPQFAEYQAKAIKGHHFPGGEYVKFLLHVVPTDTQQFIQTINDCLNELITINLPVAINYHANNMRNILIGASERMCGGTHVSSTKEVDSCQVTKIKSTNVADNKVELTVFYQC